MRKTSPLSPIVQNTSSHTLEMQGPARGFSSPAAKQHVFRQSWAAPVPIQVAGAIFRCLNSDRLYSGGRLCDTKELHKELSVEPHRQQLNNMFPANHGRRPHQYKLLERFPMSAQRLSVQRWPTQTSKHHATSHGCRDSDRRNRRHRYRGCNDVAIVRVES